MPVVDSDRRLRQLLVMLRAFAALAFMSIAITFFGASVAQGIVIGGGYYLFVSKKR